MVYVIAIVAAMVSVPKNLIDYSKEAK